MPDRATIEAATPKCPGPTRTTGTPHGPVMSEAPCGQPMSYDDAHLRWVCPVHGAVTTTHSLVARQAPPAP